MKDNNKKNKKRFFKPQVEQITDMVGRGNNTCTSSGSGNANTCQHVGNGS